MEYAANRPNRRPKAISVDALFSNRIKPDVFHQKKRMTAAFSARNNFHTFLVPDFMASLFYNQVSFHTHSPMVSHGAVVFEGSRLIRHKRDCVALAGL